ncbi:cell envelope integrity EipB family protein [Microvirga puerhi]|uniref:Cell envelope integrity EipB family protein n=1 Tax=Microvirga puerhi TaxID=2876078 RepID=A0ABS7VNX4_9HYPH|nr:cell envelope integrity EipB family protein [Microvirga puerhi]MBZ6076846.1 cell envelope integrity EipB family protein [Microvirga puerhi]
MRSLLTVSSLSLALLSPAMAEGNKAPVALVAHRAIYDLSLVRSEGSRGVDSARGRIAMDFGGDACEGYTLKYRQVTVLNSSETGSRTLDTQTATFETGDGLSMRFKSVSSVGGRNSDGVDGNAKLLPDGSLDVNLKQPKPAAFSAGGRAVFPTEHLKRLVEAGRNGETTLATKVYDGSDDGRKVYDTLAVIGHRIDPGAGQNLEEAARQDVLTAVPRWPVTVSYFPEGSGDQTPAYRVSFELYENGVSRALKLDYGDFTLKGDLQSLQIQASPKQSTCQR